MVAPNSLPLFQCALPRTLMLTEARAAQDARWMRDQLLAHAHRIRMPRHRLAAAMRRLHFATVAVSRVPGILPAVLREWQ